MRKPTQNIDNGAWKRDVFDGGCRVCIRLPVGLTCFRRWLRLALLTRMTTKKYSEAKRTTTKIQGSFTSFRMTLKTGNGVKQTTAETSSNKCGDSSLRSE